MYSPASSTLMSFTFAVCGALFFVGVALAVGMAILHARERRPLTAVSGSEDTS